MVDYPDGDYTDEEEWSDNFLEEQRDRFDEELGGNYPQARKPESLFGLFKDVWRTDDSSKVGNLTQTELGDLGISVRDCQDIASLSHFLHHKKFAEYWLDKGEITLATSMSRKGWFVELFITSKKFAHKGSLANLKQAEKSKWRIFGKNEQQQPTEEQQQ